jgi:RimJ/RimL family protein N-acetyltransferase
MTEPISSERLALRLISEHEARMIMGGERPDGLKFADGYPSEFSLETMGLFELGLTGEYGPFFIVRREDGAVMGELGGYAVSEEPRTVQIGYTLVEPEWDKGYATEGVVALIAFLRSKGVELVIADTLADHFASRRVLEKAGMESGGEFEGDEDGQAVLLVRYRLGL